MKAGLYEANLGGHLYEKRIAVSGRGKSGGSRNIIATHEDIEKTIQDGTLEEIIGNRAAKRRLRFLRLSTISTPAA